MPKLTIDGQEIEVAPGTSIIQAAEMLGIEIPRFCYHDRLRVPANCRMCLVEVKGGPPKPQASCALACAEGMEVETDSDMVRNARKGVMEFMLVNHPLDCPICDQGGECDLQDQAVGYGFDRSRYHENKRAVNNKNLGPLVKTVMTRCIHCTRCVRFAEDIAGVSDLGLLNRGEDVEIGTFIEKSINSELSGNLVDICPVGALTSKPYEFQARPWELTKTNSIDVHDAVGSNIRLDTRNGQVIRVLPRLNEDVNEEWISDKTRFAYDGLRVNRLDRPYMKDETGKLSPASWDDALNAVAQKLQSAGKPSEIFAAAGDMVDVESGVVLKNIMDSLGAKGYECRVDGGQYDTSSRGSYLFNTGIAGLEEADAFLLVGTFPRWEAALINARIRKSLLTQTGGNMAQDIRVGVIGPQADYGYPVMHVGDGPKAISELADGQGDFAKIFKKAKNPVIIAGMGAFARKDGAAVYANLRDLADIYKVIKRGWNGFNILHDAAGRVGLLDIGLTNDKGLAPLSKAKIVYLVNVDRADILSQINEDAFVIYQGHHGDAGAARADIILPGAAYSEKMALYVNTEGRVQSTQKALHPLGEAREDWKILRAIADKLGHESPYHTLFDLRDYIAQTWPVLAKIDMAPDAVDLTKTPLATSKAAMLASKPFEVSVDNFYNTNVITQNSDIMAQCKKAFLDDADHVSQAAE